MDLEPTFSSSIAFLALALSCCVMRSSSSSSSSNFLFVPTVAGVSPSSPAAVDCAVAPFLARSRPACVISKSLMARSWSSWSSTALAFAASVSACCLAFSARLMSFFCVRRFERAHSRQKMSPRRQATGSREIPRQRPHEPKGRKESRLRRAELELQFNLAMSRSWEVKTAREVFLLPIWIVHD